MKGGVYILLFSKQIDLSECLSSTRVELTDSPTVRTQPVLYALPDPVTLLTYALIPQLAFLTKAQWIFPTREGRIAFIALPVLFRVRQVSTYNGNSPDTAMLTGSGFNITWFGPSKRQVMVSRV